MALFEQKELLNIILWVSVCIMSQSILIKCAQVTINKVLISLAANLDKLMQSVRVRLGSFRHTLHDQ